MKVYRYGQGYRFGRGLRPSRQEAPSGTDLLPAEFDEGDGLTKDEMTALDGRLRYPRRGTRETDNREDDEDA